MKRLFSLLTALTLVLTVLSACSKTPEAPEVDDEQSAVAGTVDKEQDTQKEPENLPNNKPQNNQTQTQTPKPDTNVQQNTPTQSDDVDSEDVSDGSSVSVVDKNTQENNPNTSYQENVQTGLTDMVITEEFYDESELKLPRVDIKTFDGNAVTSKDTYTNATIEVSNTLPKHNMAKTAVEIRGRGNSTWTRFDKKPYKIKFLMKTDLLGMGAAKKWVLLANAFDDAMLRSALAFELGKSLEIEFASEYRYVNVFINNKYEGVYIICEQQEEGETRVNINSSKSGEVDTGYFLEFCGDNISTKPQFKLPIVDGKFLSDTGYDRHRVYIHSPKVTTLTEDQTNYIIDYTTQVNEAIFTRNWQKITELCDIDSFVNMFLVDEVFLNNDCGYSFYMYKKAGGKLHLGPLWDFDQSAGNSEHGTATFKGWYAGSNHKWYSELITMPEFKDLVKKRYLEKKDAIHGIIKRAEQIAIDNKYDFAMSNYVHNNFGNKDRWRTIPEIYNLQSYSQHVNYLMTWLTNRLTWMEDQLGI